MFNGNYIVFILKFKLIFRNQQSDKGENFLSHNIAGILETTIRSTSSQFDHPDVIKRLDCRVYERKSIMNNLDIFSLDYRVDGPLSTVLLHFF